MPQTKTIDLHSIRISQDQSVEVQIYEYLERKLRPHLYHKNMRICLIVGKGLNSKNWINRKNPVRYYTENFLNQMGFSWRSENSFWGDSGVIWVEM